MVSTQDSSWRFRIVVKKRQFAFFLVCFDGELFAPVHTHQIGLFPLNFILLLKAFYVKQSRGLSTMSWSLKNLIGV